MKIRTIAIGALAGAVALVAAAEAGVRLRGNTSVPIFRPDANSGYVVAPDQSGKSSRGQWAFNELSLANAEPFRAEPDDVLVIGDSVVFAAAAEIKAAIPDRKVWVASTGGWQLLNQLGYLNAHPQLKRVGQVVFVSNSGDFGPAAPWDPSVRLTHRPICGVCFVASRKMQAEKVYVDPPATPQTLAQIRQAFGQFRSGLNAPVEAVAYPTKREVVAGGGSAVPALLRQAFGTPDLQVTDLTSQWSESYFSDAIHPNTDGRKALARAIAEAVDL